ALLCIAVPVAAHDQEGCPHAGASDRRADVDRRHDHATGVSRDAVHHFLLSAEGGSIRLETPEGGAAAARDRIRAHLQVVARSFAAGDFTLPQVIHGEVPPGVPVMKDRKSAIRYVYAPTEKGGVVTLRTKDPVALAAVHDFLRFQIVDHGTNDPTE
ncbi:MAG TPA: hypothetical protein VIC87_08070, partial [Vicinamibacteria bacterium]